MCSHFSHYCPLTHLPPGGRRAVRGILDLVTSTARLAITVIWPTSASVDRLHDIAADRSDDVREGDTSSPSSLTDNAVNCSISQTPTILGR